MRGCPRGFIGCKVRFIKCSNKQNLNNFPKCSCKVINKFNVKKSSDVNINSLAK